MAAPSMIRLAALAFLAALLIVPIVHADSWELPSQEIYVSQDGAARITVTPRAIGDQLSYFDNLAAHGPDAHQGDTARAILERRDAHGRWNVVWRKALVNDV